MIRNLIAIALAAGFAAPALAETGVSINRIDNVANVYGRASAPATKPGGVVVYTQADVNLAGRNPVPSRAGKTVISNVRNLDSGFGRT